MTTNHETVERHGGQYARPVVEYTIQTPPADPVAVAEWTEAIRRYITPDVDSVRMSAGWLFVFRLDQVPTYTPEPVLEIARAIEFEFGVARLTSDVVEG